MTFNPNFFGIPAPTATSVISPTTLTDSEATALGLKVYFTGTSYKDGIVPTITASTPKSNLSANLIPYQAQDGSWGLKGSIHVSGITFNSAIGTGFGSTAVPSGIVLQSDGKILIHGTFSTKTFNGQSISGRLLRLNSDGTLDHAFNNNLGGGFSGTLFDVQVQSDGKILAATISTTFNGNPIGRGLLRLNSDGTLDTAFNSNLGSGIGGTGFTIARSISLQSDGKILVGAACDSLNGVAVPFGLFRLNSDGTLDTEFNSNLGIGLTFYSSSDGSLNRGIVNRTIVQSDGNIIVLGIFDMLDSGGGFTGLYSICRLDSNGLPDHAFNNNLGGGFSNGIHSSGRPIQGTMAHGAVQSDGKILVSGSYEKFANQSAPINLLRLNSNGTLDTTFNGNLGSGFAGSTVSNPTIHSDGKILIAGNFSSFNGNSSVPDGLLRLNSDGTLDHAFNNNLGGGFSSGGSVNTQIKVESDGKILVIGNFTSLNGNLSIPDGLLKLNSDGTLESYTSVTNTISGVTFNATKKEPVAIYAANSSSIVIGGASTINYTGQLTATTTTGSETMGWSFDVALASKPTWAY